MKHACYIASGLLLLAAALLAAGGRPAGDAFREAQRAIAVRAAGHQLLRAVGDSSSRLPPVLQPGPGQYRLSFPVAFSFQPDSLVAIVNRALAAAGPPDAYVVNVLEPPSEAVVFGFAMEPAGPNSLVPCSGRTQPSGRYDLLIRFRPTSGRPLLPLAAALLGLSAGLFGWQQGRQRRRGPASTQPVIPVTEPTPSAPGNEWLVGQYRFNPAQQCLYFYGERIPLTGKETSVLQVLVQRPNELIDRPALQKIWDDEGVIVGRSLDVFISRLRKKLERDPSIAIVSVTGKGYRLELPA